MIFPGMNQGLQALQGIRCAKRDKERRSDVGVKDGGPGEWKLSITMRRVQFTMTLWSAGRLVDTVFNQGYSL